MVASSKVEKPRVRGRNGQYAARGVLTGKLLRRAYSAVSPVVPPTQSFETDPRLITFDATGMSPENVDPVNAIIRGVSVITGGLIARGHDLEVDEKTLRQMKTCADEKGQVPVKVDHKSGAGAVCGYLTNFAIVGQKLKADWHLLQSHPQKEQIIETAQRMPRGVGLSAAFVGPDKPERSEKGRKAARCVELISVDYVALPAANPNGMFSAGVDSGLSAMTPEILAAITKAVSEAVAPIQAQLAEQSQQLNLVTNPPTLEDLAQMSDEQLADLGLTPEDVQAALSEIESEGAENPEGVESAEVPVGTDGAPIAEGTAVPAATGNATAASLAALTKQVTELSAQINSAKVETERATVETLFSEIEAKVTALSEENARLTQALKAGGAAATPGVDRNGVRFFSADRNKGEFENLVQLGIEEKKLSKGQAMLFARKENPAAYDDYLIRLGVKHAATE